MQNAIFTGKTKLFSLLVAGSLALAGCGSSSDNDSAPAEQSDLTNETVGGVTTQLDKVEETTSGITLEGDSATLSGKAMDGYLKNAKVCLDTNRNGACDEGEVSTTSGEDGSYSLSGVSAEDAAKYPVVVEVIKDQTIDKDTGATVAKSYTMKAPAGQASVVSPITTLIQTTLENNPTMTVEKAEETLRTALGMDEDVSLMDDYVAKGAEEGGEDYKVIHKVAQVVVEKVSEALETLETSETLTLDEASKEALTNLVYEKVIEIVDDVADSIKTVTLSGVAVDEIDTSTLSVTLDTSDIDAATVTARQEKLSINETIADSVVKTNSSTLFQDSLQDGDVYSFWPSIGYDYESEEYVFAASSERQQVVDNKLVVTEEEYNATSQAFEPYTYNSSSYYDDWTFSFYMLTDTGWELTTMTYSDWEDFKVGFESDGSVLFTNNVTGYRYKYNVTSILPLKDISIAKYAQNSFYGSNIVTIDDSLFPEGALAFEISYETLDDEYEVWGPYESCTTSYNMETGEEQESCETYDYNYLHYYGYDDNNNYGEHNISTIEELKQAYAHGGDRYYYDWKSKYSSVQFGEDGTVYYSGYDYYYDETSGYYTSNGTREQKSLTGKLVKKTVKGQELWFIETPKEYQYSYMSEDDEESFWGDHYDYFFVEIDGVIKQGDVYYAGMEYWGYERLYNDAARNAMAHAVTGVNSEYVGSYYYGYYPGATGVATDSATDEEAEESTTDSDKSVAAARRTTTTTASKQKPASMYAKPYIQKQQRVQSLLKNR